MKSTVTTKTPDNNYKVTFSFKSEANVDHATKYLNKMIKGVAAKKESTNTLIVQATTKSKLNEAEEVLYGLGGQKNKN